MINKRLFWGIVLILGTAGQVSAIAPYPQGRIRADVVEAMYQGGEKLLYKVSWSGGIKIGELEMEVLKVAGKEQTFDLQVTVKDSGIFHFFYPINDHFTTLVAGADRLPVSYEVIQEEGQGYQAIRHTRYDQERGLVRYQKNDQEPVYYSVTGKVHNEFSSFFFTRSMALEPGQAVVVPTFADGSRHEVVVRTGQETRLKSALRGDIGVLPVTPLMQFKGMYDKDGDTTIWLTNDRCRVPVRINSKILIGSLTAELVAYSNPFCDDQALYQRPLVKRVAHLQELELGE